MMDFLLFVVSAILLFLAFGLPILLKRATRRRKSFEAHSEIFFQKAKALASDDETPAEIIRGFSGMNRMLMTRHGGLILLHVFLRRASSSQATDGSKETFDTVIRPFFDSRPELANAFADGVQAWMHAVLCGATGPSGFFARLLFRNSLALMDPALVARRLSAAKDHHHHDNGNHHQPIAA